MKSLSVGRLLVGPKGAPIRPQLRKQTKLRNGERAELQFESDEPVGCRRYCRADGARPLIRFDCFGNAPHDAKQECARANGGIGDGHLAGGEARLAIE